MKKFLIFMAGICFSSVTWAEETPAKVMIGGKSSVFESRIRPSRKAAEPMTALQKLVTSVTTLPRQMSMASTTDVMEVTSRIIRSDHTKQRMDSTINRQGTPDEPGAFLTKNTYAYDASGRPVSNIRYAIDAASGQWNYQGENGYDWNEDGHMIAYWVINGDTYGETERYEYIYEEGSNVYNTLYYYNAYENDEWQPYQSCQYTLDEAGNTVEELYSQYNAGTEEWEQAQRITATYDVQGGITSCFVYFWDNATRQWVGNQDATQNFSYELDDQLREISYTQYKWSDGAYKAFGRIQYTYEEVTGLRTAIEWQYWNEEHQDWRGGYINANGRKMENSKTLFFYDDQHREIRTESYSRTEDTDYTSYYTYTTTEYNMLETGELESIHTSYGNIGGGIIEAYKRSTSRRWPVAGISPNYELSETKLNSGEDFIKSAEEIRFIDPDGTYHGQESYSFTPNATNFRCGSSKEEIYYDENGHQTGTHHWRGLRTGATSWEWQDYDDWGVYYVQGYDDYVLAGYDRYYYKGSEKYLSDGYYTTFDFTVPTENMTKWITNNNSDVFKRYKYIHSYNFMNRASDGSEDFDDYTSYYYYTQTGKEEGGWNEDGTPTTIATRCGENMQAQQNANGEIYVGWTQYEGRDNIAVLQLVDQEGYNVLADEGQTINQLSGSGHAAAFGLTTDQEGNAFVAYGDGRNGDLYDTKPYAYKLSAQNGSFLWGQQGVAIPSDVKNNVVKNMFAVGDNNFVIFTDNYDYTNRTYYINRFDADGNVAWEASKALPGSMPAVVALGEQLMVIYCSDQKAYAQLFDADLNAQWAEPVLLSGSASIAQLPYTGSLFNAKANGTQGVTVSFLNNTYNGVCYMQYVNAQGEVAMTEPAAINEEGEAAENVAYCLDETGKNITAFWQGGDWNGRFLYMRTIGLDGSKGDRVELETSASGVKVADVKSQYGYYMLAYGNAENWSNSTMKITLVNQLDKSLYSENLDTFGTAESAAVIGSEYLYYFWHHSEMDYETYTSTEATMGARRSVKALVEAAGGSIDAIEQIADTDAEGALIYNLSGQRVNASAKGINIVRQHNGKSEKSLKM